MRPPGGGRGHGRRRRLIHLRASRLVSVLEEGGVPWFGACCPLVEQEFTSPYSFVLGSLFPAQGVGAVLKMVEDGCANIVQLYVDIPAADIGLTFTNNALRSVGYDLSKQKVVKIPLAAQDYSAQAAEATDGTDCIYGGIADSNWAAFLPAMQSAGADQRLYGLQGNLNSKIVEQFPDLTQDAVISNSYPHLDGPMWEDYRGALETYDAPDLDWNSLAGLGTWAAYTAFTDIASGLEDITAETFFEAANSTTALDTGGMVPVLDLSTPYEGAGGTLPRIVNRSVYFDIAKDGKVEPLETEPLDVTNAIDGEPL
ncbi:MAG: ABC transporter substrate-binding protein [Acidimicrobiia bacterium]|nr:ABC transporter substrate-binding protein [Acidimicrobiia bacterium]